MALRYAEAKTGLDAVAQELASSLTQLRDVKLRADRVKQLVDALPTKYATLASQINAQAAANPGDAVWAAIKAEKDKLAGEFAALATLAAAMVTAVDSVEVD